MIEQLGNAIASALACGLDEKVIREEIDRFLDDPKFQKMDAETRNREIARTKDGLKFFLKQKLFSQEQSKKFSNSKSIDSILDKCFHGITNRLTYL